MPMAKVRYQLIADLPEGIDPILKEHATEFVYDIVGWALYCTGSAQGENSEDLEERFGKVHGDMMGGEEAVTNENGIIRRTTSKDQIITVAPEEESKKTGLKRKVKKKLVSSKTKHSSKDSSLKKVKKGLKPLKVKKDKRTYKLIRKTLEDVYRSKDDYLNWLREQYQREMEFYHTILSGEKDYGDVYPEFEEMFMFDSEMEEEVLASARAQLEELDRNLKDEIRLIDKISDRDWEKVAKSSNPKIALGQLLGAKARDIRENFSNYLLVRMRAQRMGRRTAFYSWEGPTIWAGQEDFGVQVDSVIDRLLKPLLGNLEDEEEVAGYLESKKDVRPE